MKKRYPAAVIGVLTALGVWHLAGPYVDFHKAAVVTPAEPKAEVVIVPPLAPDKPVPGHKRGVIHEPEAIVEAPVTPTVVEPPKAVEPPVVTPLPKSIESPTVQKPVIRPVVKAHPKAVHKVVKKKKVVRKLRKCIMKDGKLQLIR